MDYLLIAAVIGTIYLVSTIAVIYLSINAPTIESDDEPPFLRELNEEDETKEADDEPVRSRQRSGKGPE